MATLGDMYSLLAKTYPFFGLARDAHGQLFRHVLQVTVLWWERPEHTPESIWPSGQRAVQLAHRTRGDTPSQSWAMYCPSGQRSHETQDARSSRVEPSQSCSPRMKWPAGQRLVHFTQRTTSSRVVPSHAPDKYCPAAHRRVHGEHSPRSAQ